MSIRLPIPGSDDGSWGYILNEFLGVEHNEDGSLKASGSLSTKYTLPANGIPYSDLDATLKGKIDAGVGGSQDATATTKGIIKLAGALTGTAAAPAIAQGVITGGATGNIAAATITDDNVNAAAGIAQTKIQNLPIDLAGKAPLSHTHAIADITNLQSTLDAKANAATVTTDLAAKANTTDVDTALAGKADTTYVDTELAAKADTTYVDSGLAAKADTTYVDAGLAAKANTTDVDTALAGKSDVGHTHAASDVISGTFDTGLIPGLDASKITSGALPLTYGGTGGTTKAEAQTNLGITIANTPPSGGVDGDIWLEY